MEEELSKEEIKELDILIYRNDVFYLTDKFNKYIRPLVGKLFDLYTKEKVKNTEYEEGKVLSKKQEAMILKAIKQSAEEQITKEMKNYISKSKVKEIIQGLDKNISAVNDNSSENYKYAKKILQELLED